MSASRQLSERVARSIRTRALFRPGQSILVAVSGGLDSMVLLRLLHELSQQQRWRLAIGHLNHQLRGTASEADERLVSRTAKSLGLPVMLGRAEVRRLARVGKMSLEMAARQSRHDFLARTAARLGIPTIALAHHADDQLELFFLRLLRGSGGEGLAGMKWRNPSPSDPGLELVRPLLDLPKEHLRTYAIENRIPFREDASNARWDIQRNRIRHELLPLLRKHYQPALDQTIVRAMEIGGAESEFVTLAARQWLAQVRASKPKRAGVRGIGTAGPPEFPGLPVAVQRRSVQLQLLELGVASDFELVEELRLNAERPVSVKLRSAGVARPGRIAPLQQPTFQTASRDANGLVRLLEKPAAPGFRSESLRMDLAGRAGELAFSGAKLRWRRDQSGGKVPAQTPGCEFFDADRVGSKIILRHWQRGDRFQPIGMAAPVKLQDWFTNQKILRPARHELIVGATEEGEVFWVEGQRISERFKLTGKTIRRLQWRWERP